MSAGDESDQDTGARDDVIIGTAVEKLLEDGDEQAATLLLDIVDFSAEYLDTAVTDDGEGFDMYSVRLVVPAFLQTRFTEEVTDRIHAAIEAVALSVGMHIKHLSTSPALAEPGWRERAEQRLGAGPSNQATVGPAPPQWIQEDRLRFRDVGELRVYQAFKRAQQRLGDSSNITILPNPGVRTRVDSTWEPDFVIAYRGRAGVVEVDGSSHAGRAAADKSRDRFFEDSGIAYIDRWVVEDTTDDSALDALVDRFLRRLTER